MADVGRRVYLLLALPAPVVHSGETCVPLRCAQVNNTYDKEHNEHVQRWWHDRQHISARIRALQTETLLVADINPAALYRQLGELLLAVRSLAVVWEQVFYCVYTRGSWLRSKPEFVPTWHMLAPLSQWLAYEYGANVDARTITERVYRSPSIILESVCIAYLQIALLQQMATVAHIATRGGHKEHGVMLPNDSETVNLLRTAKAGAKGLIEGLLPMYFELRDGTEPFLLSPHFYRHFVARLLVAQQHYVMAMQQHQLGTVDTILTSAALFAHAARVLVAVRETAYANAELVGALAMHRRAASLMALAEALHLCESQSSTENIIHYESRTELGEPNYQAMAVEAYYCAREALALMSSAAPMRTVYESIAERLELMYNSVLPPMPASLAASAVIELRMRRTSKAKEAAAPWRREFGKIFIESKFLTPDPHTVHDDDQPGQATVNATHQMPLSSTLNIGSQTRHFVVTCVADVK